MAGLILPPRGILFDMDGTLTAPLLDFEQIRKEMGIGAVPILEALYQLPDARRREAEQVLLRHESEAAARSTLGRGCRELLAWLVQRSIGTALITRNSRASADAVVARHGLRIDVLITREDGQFKPHPAPLLSACSRLGLAPAEAWMVGDGVYDVEAGIAAGMRTLWISHGRERPFAAEPSGIVRDLPELLALLSSVCGEAKP